MNKSTTPLTDYMFAKAVKSEIPLSGTFELTPLCNFNCKMCYVRKSTEEVSHSGKPVLSTEQWISIADEACKKGMLFVLLTGGEPLLRPDFWDIYDSLIDMGLLVSINTNGSLIDEEAVEHFKRKPPRRINLTLYGISDKSYKSLCEVHNMYTKVDHAIHMLQSAGIQLKLNCSLTPYNVCDLEPMVRYAEKRGLILDVVTYMFPPVRRDASMIGYNKRFSPEESAYYRMEAYRLQYGEELYMNFLKNILKGSINPPGLDESCIDPVDGQIRCRAGKASFWITWDGKMTPCGMMVKPAVDCVEHGFSESWMTINHISQDIRLSGICNKCPDYNVCHSCAAMALTETGHFTEIPKYLCNTVYAMKKYAAQYIAKDSQQK